MASSHIPDSERRVFAEGRLQTGLAGDGAFRWAAADLTDAVEAARLRHDLSPVAAAALGRTMTSVALLLRLAAKTPTRLVMDVRGDGPLRQVLAEAEENGHLRALVGDPRASVPDRSDTKLAVGAAVGRGQLRVLREDAHGSYQSQVELVSGEIGDDVAHYLQQSEQARTAVLVGVLGRPDPVGVAAAGGVIIEALPDAGEDELTALEARLSGLPGVSRLLEEGGVEGMLEATLEGLAPRVIEERTLYYGCRCNRDRLERHLAALSPEDRREALSEEGVVEAECLFCATRYRFTPEELDAAAAAS
jgi:molecular chaperone Hsp33